MAAGLGYILVVTLLYFTFSRGAWIACLVGVFFYLWPDKKRFIPVLLVCFPLVIMLASQELTRQGRPLNPLIFDETYPRLRSFEVATSIWEHQPLWGRGTGTYRYFSQSLGNKIDVPDNMYLMILAETGLLGLACRVGFFSRL